MTASRDAAKPPAEHAREFLFRNFFSSLSGLSFGGWFRLLADNGFRIEPRYWPRAAFLTAGGLVNSCFSQIGRAHV